MDTVQASEPALFGLMYLGSHLGSGVGAGVGAIFVPVRAWVPEA
jgi:hypothetical protein